MIYGFFILWYTQLFRAFSLDLGNIWVNEYRVSIFYMHYSTFL